MTNAFEPTEFAREFQAFLQGVNRLVPPRSSPIRDMLAEHLGAEPGDLPLLSDRLEAASSSSPKSLHARRSVTSSSFSPPRLATSSPLFLGSWDDRPVALLVMAGDERSHFESRLTVEVIAAEQTTIRSLLARLRARRAELNVYRGRTLSFSFSPHGRFSLDFLRLPALDRSQVILPEADLAAIEQHTLGIARHTAALGQALALARSLQPAMVVFEDVDLVAHERTMPAASTNPLLFELLNEMDGLAEDADVIFVLTTNRIELLEPAAGHAPGPHRPGGRDQAARRRVPPTAARAVPARSAWRGARPRARTDRGCDRRGQRRLRP